MTHPEPQGAVSSAGKEQVLKPCPFCGDEPRVVEPHQSDRSIEGETDDEEWLSFVECDCVDMFFVKGSATSQDDARRSVIAAWNRRTTTPKAETGKELLAPLDNVRVLESNSVGVGMAIAAGIVMNCWGETTIASEILGAAGATSLDVMRGWGVDDYDLNILSPLFATPSTKGSPDV